MGASRSDMRSNSSRFLINQFLEEMDGVKKDKKIIFVIMSIKQYFYKSIQNTFSSSSHKRAKSPMIKCTYVVFKNNQLIFFISYNTIK